MVAALGYTVPTTHNDFWVYRDSWRSSHEDSLGQSKSRDPRQGTMAHGSISVFLIAKVFDLSLFLLITLTFGFSVISASLNE